MSLLPTRSLRPSGVRGPLAVLALSLGLTLGACTAPEDLAPAPSPTPQASPGVPLGPEEWARALATLPTLEVKGRAPRTGYNRAAFGQRWKDIDRNGCDQRNDVLARDLSAVTTSRGGCKVTSGELLDPYTGTTIAFERGEKTSAAVQIDHVVPLADAWQKGAQQWTPEQREIFANDTANLLAVDGPMNQAKGAADAATWLPPNRSFRCDYAAIHVRVKAAYHLWATPAEAEALGRILHACVDKGHAP